MRVPHLGHVVFYVRDLAASLAKVNLRDDRAPDGNVGEDRHPRVPGVGGREEVGQGMPANLDMSAIQADSHQYPTGRSCRLSCDSADGPSQLRPSSWSCRRAGVVRLSDFLRF